MDHLPIFLDIAGKPVAVIGGGTAAARKAEMALRCGANVRVFADALSADFHDIADHERLSHLREPPTRDNLAGCAVVFGAADDETANRAAYALAREIGALVNVADVPELCDFIMPTILDRAPLTVAISTGGASPILGRMLRSRLETQIPAGYGALLGWVRERRARVAAALTTPAARRRFWENLLDGPLADRVLRGEMADAEATFAQALADAAADRAPGGEVYLVGAGPGDPDLLTFRALRLMQRADVVLYDRLIGDGILDLVRRDAERIYVGKEPNRHPMPQQEISALMARLAHAGKRVLRLKGGDPFMFGRGGEEIELLAREGIPFQVVPGITAAVGCAAYAGIPLTHRDHAQTCVFVTAHAKDGRMALDWDAVLRPRQTVALYMGLGGLGDLMRGFVEHGAAPDLPAAVIDNGTRPNQTVVTATVATLAERASQAGLRGPAMIIVGTVVSLRDRLAAPADNRP